MYDSECNFILPKSGLQCNFPGSTPTESPVPCTVEVSSTDRACPRHFVLHLAEHSLAQERLFTSDAVQHQSGNAPAAFLELFWVVLETKSHVYHPLPAPDHHILFALFLSCAGLMENAVVSPSSLPGKTATFKP